MRSKSKVIRNTSVGFILFGMMVTTLCMPKNLYAYSCARVPVAICSTGGTHIPLPQYVCCQLRDEQGHVKWRNTWVPTCCQQADRHATYDLGCRMNSPVFGMGTGIIGNCQFSHATCPLNETR